MTGTPPPPPYDPPPPGSGGPPGYGGPVEGASAATGWAGPPLAGWGRRVGAALIDYVIPGSIAALFAAQGSSIGQLFRLLALAWAVYQAYQAGQTGQSLGKRTMGIRLLREQDGQLVGGGVGVGRYFLHIVDTLPCGLGFLWPLWDAKRQTFADKILKTVVVVG